MQQTSSAKAFHQSTEAIWIFHVDFNKFQESWKHRSIAFQRDNFVCDEKQRAHISRGHIIGWGGGDARRRKMTCHLHLWNVSQYYFSYHQRRMKAEKNWITRRCMISCAPSFFLSVYSFTHNSRGLGVCLHHFSRVTFWWNWNHSFTWLRVAQLTLPSAILFVSGGSMTSRETQPDIES